MMISIKFLSPTTWKRLLEISAVFRSLTRRSMRSQWIDTAVQAGVNDVSSIYFSLSHAKSVAVKNDLLKQAVTNAKSKADIAASALGLNVIGVKSINIEPINGFPPPEPLMARDKTLT